MNHSRHIIVGLVLGVATGLIALPQNGIRLAFWVGVLAMVLFIAVHYLEDLLNYCLKNRVKK